MPDITQKILPSIVRVNRFWNFVVLQSVTINYEVLKLQPKLFLKALFDKKKFVNTKPAYFTKNHFNHHIDFRLSQVRELVCSFNIKYKNYDLKSTFHITMNVSEKTLLIVNGDH